MDLSVIIVSYNARDLIKECIRRLYETIGNRVFEVIVADNCSTDGSADMVEREFPDVRLIRLPVNSGFSAANNKAIMAARGRNILMLNSDAFVRKGTVETLCGFLEAHPEAAAVGPKVLNIDGTLQNKGYFFPSIGYSLLVLFGLNFLLSESLKRLLFPQYFWNENETRQVDYLQGSCLLMRRAIFDKVGLFPEVYFMYFEEKEWFYRASLRGVRAWYVPEAEVLHVGSASPLEGRTDVFDRSKVLYYKRNVGRFRGGGIATFQLLATMLDMAVSQFSEEVKRAVLRRQFKQQLYLLRKLVQKTDPDNEDMNI